MKSYANSHSSAVARPRVTAWSLVRAALRLIIPFALAAFALAAVAAAQDRGRVRLDALERLAPKASDTVNVEVDGVLIKLASGILSDKEPDERTVKQIIAGLRGVYVRSYNFEKEGQYADSDIAPVREQLRAPAWTRVVDVKSHDAGDDADAEIYVATDGARVAGMTILVAEPKEITVINIVGDIDVEKLKRLEGTLGIPHIHIGRKGQASPRDDHK